MSMSLEERRAERRRRRQMEEESLSGTKSADELHADVQERLARRRKEREERMANIASSVATVNGEDDFERKRRERREARLRASEETDYSSTNDYSSRRNRRRGTEDDTSEDTTSTSSYSSYRARRRRNWDDEETPVVNEEPTSSVPDTSEEDAAEERRRRQRQEEEEEARRQAEREEEEERQRQAALDEERRRQREEEERELQEQQRLQEEEEEEERQRQGNAAENESVSEGSSDDDSYNQQRDKNKLFIDEDDGIDSKKGPDVGKRVLSSKLDINVVHSEPIVSDGKNKIEFSVVHEKSLSLDRGSTLEVNNNKIQEKLDKFEHLKDESDKKKSKDKSLIIPIVEKDGFKGKLKKFETEIKELDSSKGKTGGQSAKSVILTPQTHKLSEKLQHFELAAKSQSATRTSARNVKYELEKIGSTQNQRKALLGRWSASETQINKPEVRDTAKRNVLDRWKSVDKQHPQDQHTVKLPNERKEVLTKRLSGNTEFIASKYLEKATKSIDETTSPKTPLSASQKHSFSQSFEQRLSSPPTEAQSDHSDLNGNQSRSKITSRWQREDGNVSAGNSGTPRSRFSASSIERNGRDSSFDSSAPHSRGSSVDESSGLARKSSCQLEEEEEAERERIRQEEEASEKAARMAAEEGQKKRGKRKGLGGLTPEKKKKLKQIIMQKAAEDLKKEALAKAEEKEKFINERVGPLNAESLGEAELRKLIKSLHEKLAQIHSESYDIEFKCKKQEQEIVDLNMKISDSRGKFAKPVLRKVNKTEQKFAALSKKQEVKDDFRETLKSAHDEDEPAE